jgi:hypothetical protein
LVLIHFDPGDARRAMLFYPFGLREGTPTASNIIARGEIRDANGVQHYSPGCNPGIKDVAINPQQHSNGVPHHNSRQYFLWEPA